MKAGVLKHGCLMHAYMTADLGAFTAGLIYGEDGAEVLSDSIRMGCQPTSVITKEGPFYMQKLCCTLVLANLTHQLMSNPEWPVAT